MPTRRKSRIAGVTLLGIVCATIVLVAASIQGGALPAPLPLFPRDNWWNADISAAPVDPASAAFIAFIGSTRSMHPDFGGDVTPGGTEIYGFPYAVVDGTLTKRAVQFQYSDESDGVDHTTGASVPFYPIPDEAITQGHWMESGEPGNVDLRSTSDRHLLIVDRDHRFLYELYNVFYDGSQWHAGSGAFFNLNANGRRPDGWTSADAAGLAILPGLVRYDEVFGSGEIQHAFRVTVRATNGYVYPASHRAGSTVGALPMGARLRLKASKDLSPFTPEVQRIFRAMQRYGLIVADNGSDMFVSGTYDTRWDNDVLNPAFRAVTASDFEVVSLGYVPTAAAPTITAQPLNQTAWAGANATFAVAATGNPVPTYQWQVSIDGGSSWTNLTNTAPYGGVTTVTLTLTNVAGGLTGAEYRSVATNSSGSATSGAATLTVVTVAPTMTVQPVSKSVRAGQNLEFVVAVSAAPPPSYQWQVSTNRGALWTNLADAAPYGGATTASLVVTLATAGLDGYQYRCVVTNTVGQATSDAATLSVVPGVYSPRKDLVADFGTAFGVWLRDGSTAAWMQLDVLSAKTIVTGDLDGNGTDDVIVDFGASQGIWVYYNHSNWVHLHALTANRMAVGDLDGNGQAELLIDFPGVGIWVWTNNTYWFQLHPSNSTNIVVGDLDGNGKREAIIDFPGAGIWVWQNNTSWFRLHPLNSRLMAVGDFDGNNKDDVIVDFAGYGIWSYANNSSWSQVHPLSVVHLAAGDVVGNGQSDLIVDFGQTYGIWLLLNGTTWSQLHTLTSANIVTGDLDSNGKADVIINFGAAGLWEYANNATWSQLHSASPGAIAVGHINAP